MSDLSGEAHLKVVLEEVENCIDDAKMFIEKAFKEGYEELETNIDRALTKLDEAKGRM